MQLIWSDLKSFIVQRNASVQFVDVTGVYWIHAFSPPYNAEGLVIKDGGIDQIDFETNFKSSANQPISPTVTTQFELNNKDLKLAKGSSIVDSTNSASISIRIPGTFGSGNGRYIAGGYAISGDYRPDDFVTVRVEDTDRLIALAIAQSNDPTATIPLSDSAIQGLGNIPGFGAFPNYPVVKSYTDDDLGQTDQGWFFWPLAMGNNLPPVGECEVEPIGGYAFVPAGFYLKCMYFRSVSIGSFQINFYWAKLE